MKYLTAQEILFIHSVVISETGGSHGVRDLGLLESSLACPKQSFGGQSLYVKLEDKTAALFLALMKNHPFVDGNKRTALTAAGIFYRLNGFELEAAHEDVVKFCFKVAGEKVSTSEISLWIKKHSKKVT